MVTKKAAVKKKTPAKASKAKPKAKAATKKKPSRKPAAAPKIGVEFPAVDEATMDQAFALFKEACEMIGWNMAVGVDDNDEICGICAGDESYMYEMIGSNPSKED